MNKENTWHHLLLSSKSSAIRSLEMLNKDTTKTVYVVDENNSLLGTITDGDIRRGLIAGRTLADSVTAFMNKHFIYSTISDLQSLNESRLTSNSLNSLPVLDDLGQIVHIFTSKELLGSLARDVDVVLMAGGKGKRLRPYTENCPKPMLRVDGKPMLQIVLEQCIQAGLKSFYLSVNYLKDQVINHFGDGSKWGVTIQYLEEEPDRPLGTAGCLSLLPKEVNTNILVVNGDVLTKLNYVDLIDYHKKSTSTATLCVRDHFVQLPYGVVTTNGSHLESFVEKPTSRYLINTGIYVLDKTALQLVQSNQIIDMPDLLSNIQASGSTVSVCPLHEYWLDVGRPEHLEDARLNWKG